MFSGLVNSATLVYILKSLWIILLLHNNRNVFKHAGNGSYSEAETKKQNKYTQYMLFSDVMWLWENHFKYYSSHRRKWWAKS